MNSNRRTSVEWRQMVAAQVLPADIRRMAGELNRSLSTANERNDWCALSAQFMKEPHRVLHPKGARMVASRLLPYFNLQTAAGMVVPAIIDVASVKSITSSAVCQSLYLSNVSVGPRNDSAPPEPGKQPHTRLFWLPQTKQELVGAHQFYFTFEAVTGGQLSQTVEVNEGNDFPFDIIVLGMTFLRTYPCTFRRNPNEIRFTASNKQELRIAPFEELMVSEKYYFDEKKQQVLMGKEAHRVLFANDWNADVSEPHVDRNTLRMLHDVAPRTTRPTVHIPRRPSSRQRP